MIPSSPSLSSQRQRDWCMSTNSWILSLQDIVSKCSATTRVGHIQPTAHRGPQEREPLLCAWAKNLVSPSAISGTRDG